MNSQSFEIAFTLGGGMLFLLQVLHGAGMGARSKLSHHAGQHGGDTIRRRDSRRRAD